MKHPISCYEKFNINIPKKTNLIFKRNLYVTLYVQHLYVTFIYNIKNKRMQNKLQNVERRLQWVFMHLQP